MGYPYMLGNFSIEVVDKMSIYINIIKLVSKNREIIRSSFEITEFYYL